MCRHNATLQVVLLLVVTRVAPAQDCTPVWKPTEPPGGVGTSVFSAIWWDPDAGGPEPMRAVAGGDFVAVNPPARSIAYWTGRAWVGIGTGLAGPVYTMHVRGDELVAGGLFAATAAGVVVNSIARWDGSAWLPLGAGLRYGSSVGTVRAIAEFGGELYAGGTFSSAASHPDGGVARWDGQSWQMLGTGVNGTVHAPAEYRGELIVGGDFTSAGGQEIYNIAAWTGTDWHWLRGVSGTVYGLALSGDDLLAVGDFEWAGGVRVRRAGVWNGTGWRALDASFAPNGTIRGAIVAGAYTTVFGDFTQYDSQPLRRLARFNGRAWSEIGGGTNGPVNAAALHGDELAVAGTFTMVGDGAVSGFSIWNEMTWSESDRPSLNGPIHVLRTIAGDFYAGGAFTRFGSAPINRVALRAGNNWVALGAGFNGDVYALTTYAGGLVAGGSFTRSGSLSTRLVAIWNGAYWRSISSTQMQGDAVYALTVYDSRLIAAGALPTYGGVAQLLENWTGMGLGANNPVRALQVFDETLVVGGSFTLPATFVARWDGTSWTRLDSGLRDGGVQALASVGGELYAAGTLEATPGYSGAVARWSGSQWVRVGDGLTGRADAIRGFGAGLAATGDLRRISGGVHDAAWLWDGVEWTPTGLSVSPAGAELRAIAVRGGHLEVGGALESVNGFATGFWTRYGPDVLGDLDQDTDVDIGDLAILLANFGAVGASESEGDLDGDAVVDLSDLAELMALFGTDCPP